MKYFFCAFALVMPVLVVPQFTTQDKATELEGKWTITSWAEGDVQFKERVGARVFIEKHKISIMLPDRTESAAFRLDSAKKPKQIDFIVEDEEFAGIYALEKDSLTFCFTKNSKEAGRPMDFIAKGIVNLLVLKRAK